MHGVPQAGEIPVQETPTRSARMLVPAYTGQRRHVSSLYVPVFGLVWTTRLQRIGPDPKHLIDGIQRVDFKFVVGVLTGDKNLHIVVAVDFRIAFGKRGDDVRFGNGEPDIEITVVPKQRDAGIMPGRLAGDDIDERLRARRFLPARFVEPPIQSDDAGSAIARVMLQRWISSAARSRHENNQAGQ
jgi:hypothetical protein